MIRALVIGDPHIRNKEIEYTDRMIAEIIQIAKDMSPDFIVVLGDTLDTFDKIRGDPLTRAIDFLGNLSDISYLVLLIGNHDLRHNQVYLNPDGSETPVHPFTSLKRWNNTLVCDIATVFEISGTKFCGVPYVPMGKYADAIAHIDRKDIRCFFSHQDFYGVRYKLEDAPSTVGDPWPSDAPLNISGHIHEEQIIAPNLIYVGTPIQQDYGASPDKGVSIFSFPDVSTLSSGELDYKYERIPLVTVPLRKQYTIAASNLSHFTSLLEELRFRHGDSRTHLTKIVVTGTVAEIATVMSTPLIKDISSVPGVKIVRDPTGTDIGLTFGSDVTDLPDQDPSIKHRYTFIDILRNLLLQDASTKEAYNSLFPESAI